MCNVIVSGLYMKYDKPLNQRLQFKYNLYNRIVYIASNRLEYPQNRFGGILYDDYQRIR